MSLNELLRKIEYFKSIYFVLDKHSFLSYPLKKEQADILIDAMFNPISLNDSMANIDQLYRENLLVTV